ncbi:MAG: leucine-rich repeat domain-containing protein [Bacteroides cellulosilyticus]
MKFPTNLKNISNSAFEKCTALEKVVLPEGLTNIDYHAFYQCSALKEISFPSTLTTLGDAVFYRCTSLTEIALPASLTYCYYPFYECYNIKESHQPGFRPSFPAR